jgi:hypothetical protein
MQVFYEEHLKITHEKKQQEYPSCSNFTTFLLILYKSLVNECHVSKPLLIL